MALTGTFTQSYKAARASRVPKRRRTAVAVRVGIIAARILPSWAALRSFVLTVGGLVLLTSAAWQLAIPAGMAVGGISLLILDYLMSGSAK